MEQWNMGDSTGRWENFLGRKVEALTAAGSRPGEGEKEMYLLNFFVIKYYFRGEHLEDTGLGGGVGDWGQY